MTVLAADLGGSLVLGIFTLVAGALGFGGGLLSERWRQRGDREARAAARAQVRDDNQREALIRCHDAAQEWRSALDPWFRGDIPMNFPSQERAARLEFVKVLARVRSTAVLEAAHRFQVVAVEAAAAEPATSGEARPWSAAIRRGDVGLEDVDEALKTLTEAVEGELSRYL